jgi:hypothetical protein
LKGWNFLVSDTPANAEVTIEIIHVVPKAGGMLQKATEKEKDEVIGRYIYKVSDLFREVSYTAKKYREPLDGEQGGLVSAYFQLLTYCPDERKPPQGATENRTAFNAAEGGKGSGRGASQASSTGIDSVPTSERVPLTPWGIDVIPVVSEPCQPKASASRSGSRGGAGGGDGGGGGAVPHPSMLQRVEGLFGFGGTKKDDAKDPKAFAGKLLEAGLADFQKPLQEHGVDTIEVARHISNEELGTIGLKAGHIRKFRMAFPQGDDYLIVNPGNVSGTGVPCRSGKSESSDVVRTIPWGATVNGVDQGDRWLKVGDNYLPMDMNGQGVVQQKGNSTDQASPVQSTPAKSSAKATPKNAGIVSKVEHLGAEVEGGFMSALHSVANMMHLSGDSSASASKSASKAASSTKAVPPSPSGSLKDTVPAVNASAYPPPST